VAHIIAPRRIAVATLSELDYDRVSVGMPVEVQFATNPSKKVDARISQILPTSDPEEQEYRVYLDVDIEEEKLIPGLTGKITVIVSERKDAVLVPSQAVLGNTVLKVENNRIREVEVKTGYRTMMVVEILDGLEAGDVIVTESTHLFKNGQIVKREWE